jgi:hypothetical protein
MMNCMYLHASQVVLIQLKRNMMKEDIPLQSNICKNFPSTRSCQHLKATLEIEALQQIRQQTTHPEDTCK